MLLLLLHLLLCWRGRPTLSNPPADLTAAAANLCRPHRPPQVEHLRREAIECEAEADARASALDYEKVRRPGRSQRLGEGTGNALGRRPGALS